MSETPIDDLMNNHRILERKAIWNWIAKADITDCALLLEEIRVVHDNIIVFHPNVDALQKVASVAEG